MVSFIRPAMSQTPRCRRASPVWIPTVFLAVVLLGWWAAPMDAQVSVNGEVGAEVMGRVLELGSGMPIRAAAVTLAGSGVIHMTDESGAFRFQDVEMGPHTLTIRHPAYQTRVVPLEVEGTGVVHDMTIHLSTQLVPLEPVEVSVARMGPRTSTLERLDWMEGMGLGVQFDRAAIEAARFGGLLNLLATVPGVRISAGGSSPGESMVFLNPQYACQPSVYVDRVRSPLAGASVNDVVSLSLVESVEVYRRLSELPAAFADDVARRCGAVAIQTRRSPGEAEPFRWGQFLTLSGFLTLSYFLAMAR